MAMAAMTLSGCGVKVDVNMPTPPSVQVAVGSTEKDTPPQKAAAEEGDLKPEPPKRENSAPVTGQPGRTVNPPDVSAPESRKKPSAEQIAKWGILTYEPLRLIVCNDGFADPAVQSLAISPDGKWYALGGTKLTLWNTKDAESSADLLAKYQQDEVKRPIRSVAFSPDGQWIASGDQEGHLRIWAIDDQREIIATKAHSGHLTQVAFSPNSLLLATTSYSGDVHVWKLPEGKKLKSLKMDAQEISRIVFLTDSLLASAGSEAGIWNIETGKKETPLTTKYLRGPALGLSRDHSILAFNDPDSNVQLWDVQNSRLTGSTLRGASATLIAFSQDRKWIATYASDYLIRIWDAATGHVVQVIDSDGGRTSDMEWLPDSNVLIIASEQGRVRIWGTADASKSLGVPAIQMPTLESISKTPQRSLSSAQFQRVIDLRSFPRLPGAVLQWSNYGMCAYAVNASQKEAELFYRYVLENSGWTEVAPQTAQPGLIFRKDDCELNVSFAPATPGPSGPEADQLQVSLHFAGNYDVRWLPKFSETDSKTAWNSFSLVSYRTQADMTDVEVALLKQFHDAGWTAYSRLASSSSDDPKSRMFSMLQGGSELIVSIGHPADSTRELFVQTSVSVSNNSLPIPPDAGWIEFDSSSNLQLVANTKMDLQETTNFFDLQMEAEGWLPRETGRNFKEDRAWLTYIRGQQDVVLRLTTLPSGRTRIVVGDAARSSWQLQKPDESSEKADSSSIEAADLKLPKGATAISFNVDQKNIKYEVADATPTMLGEQFITQMESLKWKLESAGVRSDEYVFITFSKAKAEIQLRARADGKKSTAMISGDGLLWTKPLPTPPVRTSYETWLRRNHKEASLEHLDEFSREMHKLPIGTTP